MGWLVNADGRVLASLEVASDRRSRRRGLLGRDGVEGALLLTHTRSVHTFGMRFSLDVAFLDRNMTVIGTVRLAPNRIAVPRLRARSVIEADAGSFGRWGLHVGDELEARLVADDGPAA